MKSSFASHQCCSGPMIFAGVMALLNINSTKLVRTSPPKQMVIV